MNLITSKNIKKVSSAFHGLLAGIVVLALLALISCGYSRELIILWCASVLCACCFGWVLGSWYVPIKGERWHFEPYLVTPIVSLLSAVSAGLIYMLATEFSSSAQNMFNSGSVFSGGIFLGLYAFVLTSPVTVVTGVLVALYLYKFGGCQNAL